MNMDNIMVSCISLTAVQDPTNVCFRTRSRTQSSPRYHSDEQLKCHTLILVCTLGFIRLASETQDLNAQSKKKRALLQHGRSIGSKQNVFNERVRQVRSLLSVSAKCVRKPGLILSWTVYPVVKPAVAYSWQSKVCWSWLVRRLALYHVYPYCGCITPCITPS